MPSVPPGDGDVEFGEAGVDEHGRAGAQGEVDADVVVGDPPGDPPTRGGPSDGWIPAPSTEGTTPGTDPGTEPTDETTATDVAAIAASAVDSPTATDSRTEGGAVEGNAVVGDDTGTKSSSGGAMAAVLWWTFGLLMTALLVIGLFMVLMLARRGEQDSGEDQDAELGDGVVDVVGGAHDE